MSTFNTSVAKLRFSNVDATLRKRQGGGFEAGAAIVGDLDARGIDGTWNWEPVKARSTRDAESRAKAAIARLITNAAERIEARAAELLARSKVLRGAAEELVTP